MLNRPFAASDSHDTKPPCYTALARQQGTHHANENMTTIVLLFFKPKNNSLHFHCPFVEDNVTHKRVRLALS